MFNATESMLVQAIKIEKLAFTNSLYFQFIKRLNRLKLAIKTCRDTLRI